MPETIEKKYVIEKRDDKWCLLTKDGSSVIACHDTEEAAKAQESAIGAAKANAAKSIAAIRSYDYPVTASPIDFVGRTFDEVEAFDELREGVCDVLESLNKSLRGIVDDGNMSTEDKRSKIAESLAQFMAAIKAELPDLASYAAAEEALKKYAKPQEAPVPEAFELKNVELFASGKHNGDDYSEKDLDDMVAAYETQGYQAPLKLGHDETPGKPAMGWVANLRREGGKLLGDITNIPKEIYDLIQRRGYDRVSSEIYWNLKTGGKNFRRALKAVALLGADVPAVSSLTPLHKLFSGVTGEVKFYDSTNRSQPHMSTEKEQLEALQRQLAELQQNIAGGDGDSNAPITKTLGEMQAAVKLLSKKVEENAETSKKLLAQQDENAELVKRLSVLEDERRKSRITKIVEEVKIPAFRPYMQALLEAATDGEEKVVKFSRAGKTEDRTVESIVKDMISDINKMAHGLFKTHTNGSGERNFSADGDVDFTDKQQVANLVDTKAKAYMVQTKVSYKDALHAVLAAEPELKQAYTS